MTRDLAGQRFGKLVALRPIGRRNRYVLWECACDCGNKAEVTTELLTGGKVKSCGCLATGRRREVHKGKRFGRLTAVDPVDPASPAGRAVAASPAGEGASAFWRCVCTCGNECPVAEVDLLSGSATSCGCATTARSGRAGAASAGIASAAKPARKSRAKDIVGQRFGELTAIEPTNRREAGSVVWHCRCSCGRETDVSLVNLQRRKHPTCGNSHESEQR